MSRWCRFTQGPGLYPHSTGKRKSESSQGHTLTVTLCLFTFLSLRWVTVPRILPCFLLMMLTLKKLPLFNLRGSLCLPCMHGRSGDNLWEVVFFFRPGDSRDPPQLVKLISSACISWAISPAQHWHFCSIQSNCFVKDFMAVLWCLSASICL